MIRAYHIIAAMSLLTSDLSERMTTDGCRCIGGGGGVLLGRDGLLQPVIGMVYGSSTTPMAMYLTGDIVRHVVGHMMQLEQQFTTQPSR